MKGRKRIQGLLGGLILLLLLALTVALWPVGKRSDSLTDLVEKLPPGVDLGMENVHYSQNESGRKSWELDAGRDDYQRDTKELALNRVRFVYYLENARGQLNVNAGQGVLNQSRQQLQLTDGVIMLAAAGEKFQTQSLHYDLEKKQAHTDDLVQIENSQMKLTGKGMQLDIKQEHLRLFADVHAIFYSSAQEGSGK